MTSTTEPLQQLEVLERQIRQGAFREAHMQSAALAKEYYTRAAAPSEVRARHVGLALRLHAIAERLCRDGGVEANGCASATPEGTRRHDAGVTWEDMIHPTRTLSDIAGLDDVKAVLNAEVIEPIRHASAYARFGLQPSTNLLLVGPPGNGKTVVAEAVAGEVGAPLLLATPAKIKSQWVGESEKNIDRVFKCALSLPKAVIFFDEADSILGAGGNANVQILQQFLQSCDDFMNNRRMDQVLILLGATNHPWRIDAAALRPGRFSRHIVVGLPDEAARAQLVSISLREKPVDPHFSIQAAAARTEGFSGAELSETVRQAELNAVRRGVNLGVPSVLVWEDFEDALTRATRRPGAQSMQPYLDWIAGRQRSQ